MVETEHAQRKIVKIDTKYLSYGMQRDCASSAILRGWGGSL